MGHDTVRYTTNHVTTWYLRVCLKIEYMVAMVAMLAMLAMLAMK